MAEQIELAVSKREVTGKATKRLRKAGIIPANIYGHHEASEAVQLEALAFDALRRAHKTSGIISLLMDGSGGTQTALVRHIQRLFFRKLQRYHPLCLDGSVLRCLPELSLHSCRLPLHLHGRRPLHRRILAYC